MNYRDKPNGKIIGTLPKGTVVEYIPRSVTECGGHIWIEIRYSGKGNFVAKEFLEL